MLSPSSSRNILLHRLGGCGTVLLILLPMWAGCARSPSNQPPLSPRETVALLIQARGAGDYQKMRSLIVSERNADVMTTLLAVDGFLAANQQLCELVRTKVGPGLSQTIDQSHYAYRLEIFSKYVELLDDSIVGQAATVAFLVDQQLPARHAQLRLVDGAWRYDPGPGDYQQLARAFERMAHGLRQAFQEIRGGRIGLNELRQDPERLINEVRIRLLPGVKMLPKPFEDDSG